MAFLKVGKRVYYLENQLNFVHLHPQELGINVKHPRVICGRNLKQYILKPEGKKDDKCNK